MFLAFVSIGVVLRCSLQMHSPQRLRGRLCQFVPAVGMQFRKNVREEEFHCAHADLQEIGDFPVRKTPAHQFQNLISAKGCRLSRLRAFAKFTTYLAKKLGERLVGLVTMRGCSSATIGIPSIRCLAHSRGFRHQVTASEFFVGPSRVVDTCQIVVLSCEFLLYPVNELNHDGTW
jgi:hypothetical protein